MPELPIGEIDDSTEKHSSFDGVYAEAELDGFELESLRVRLSIIGTIEFDGVSMRPDKSKTNIPVDADINRAELWFRDYADYDKEFVISVWLDEQFDTLRVTKQISDEKAQRVLETHSDGVWDYAE